MTKRNCLVFFLITALIFTMCSVSVFATDNTASNDAAANDTVNETATDNTTVGDATEEEAAANDNVVSSDDTEKNDAEGDKAEADDTETSGTTESENGEEEHDHDHEEETKKKGLSTTAIVLLAVFGAIILIFAALYIFKPGFRERVKKFFREYKSELKKVVWSSKADVLKNTKIVVIGIVAIAVVIGLVDIGLGALIDLIGKIGK